MSSSAQLPKRVVLLGASNLARGMSTVIETVRVLWNEPVEIMAALGHGRSYGLTSSVLSRRLPGIVHCGLWRALETAPPAETYALVTDIGNDLVYGQSVETLLGWVETCLDRLEAADSQITLTSLPLESLRRLSPWQFALLRRVLFPTRQLSLEDVLQQAEALNARLSEVAVEREIRLISPQKLWYGFDPIHIRRRQWRAAWDTVFSPWRIATMAPRSVRGSLRRYLYLRLLVPEERRLLGFEQRCVQPAGRLADGTTIALY